MTDLSTLDTVSACNAGAEIELTHPVTREPLGIFIKVLGRDSSTFKEHLRKSINDRLRKAAIDKRRNRDGDFRTVEEVEKDGTESLVACTVGWREGAVEAITFGGKQIPFSAKAAFEIYTSLPWIRQQVDDAIGDLENFLKA